MLRGDESQEREREGYRMAKEEENNRVRFLSI